MNLENIDIQGLTDEEVKLSRKQYGENRIEFIKKNKLLVFLKAIFSEPMIVLLLAASLIYFITGNIGDGLFMVFAIILVASISLYQDRRSRKALKQLQKFTETQCKVIRNGIVTEIPSQQLVIDDYFIIEEGNYIHADGEIVHSNDFAVNESLLTGESLPVFKGQNHKNNKVYKGTSTVGGLAIIKVTKIGKDTEIGKISKSLEELADVPSPLETQINNFVKKMVMWGSVFFLIVWALNYVKTYNILDSLLKALTLAMSILPEEIPVAFATFMALGAWRLMKCGIVVKQMKTIETLGIATVLCLDKTGTITENRMSLNCIWNVFEKNIKYLDDPLSANDLSLIETAMWASEPIPFDMMEIAIHNKYGELTKEDLRNDFKMIHEYPLAGSPPMMTHIFENHLNNRIIAAKGAIERILSVSKPGKKIMSQVENITNNLTHEGYRVLGVASAVCNSSDFPKDQSELDFSFIGLIAFHDPPKKNIKDVFKRFYKAGIKIKVITGDHAMTTRAIVKSINFKGFENAVSGAEFMALNETDQIKAVQKSNIFYRMFPEAKLKVINLLKKSGEITAMTGDGVNDAPALKASHIGIAMGKKGTEIAKESASLVLVDDDLARMVDAIEMGRKIYSNLKKAIRYIISIHIPIILTVTIPLILGWKYPHIFSPVHVILLELIMGPTCSIIYENEPIESGLMNESPRPFTSTFFNNKELTVSIIQGLAITLGVMLTYQYGVMEGLSEDLTRTMVFVTLITSNIVLTLVNRSFTYSIIKTFKYKNLLVATMIGLTIAFTGMMLVISPLRTFFDFESISLDQLILSITSGITFTLWYEIVKWFKRMDILKNPI